MELDNNHSYLNQLDAGELIKANGEHGALKMVSQQFEALFLQNVLKQMRSASDVMADKDSPLSSQNNGMYRDWHDAELAGRLSQVQSTGLAEVMIKQLSAGLKSDPETVASSNQPSSDTNTRAMQPALILPFVSKLPE
ncbi:peptidoglycan hydrolase [Shewanella sp. Choline-02u-19]|jgi:flagellar protein FlgJ|uniref:rod-binding protein n=1 Tax=unclassified Shewanella TaxID=196818 RepID=UPI000C3264C7|nr:MULTISPECIES: rod-binding protein [unclassified Shewanella]PKG56099.1 peptidoglycan hydrolase [Shewanella sp. GutDb-MelDb]PKH57271.1 peptidoglycan hydrolase [Shewanella sp. Bg11-22]PKI29615.1 peptidoglycan hydrolase [Shewanella sp. Choline-02u-19]